MQAGMDKSSPRMPRLLLARNQVFEQAALQQKGRFAASP